jgi:hypothetical protein
MLNNLEHVIHVMKRSKEELSETASNKRVFVLLKCHVSQSLYDERTRMIGQLYHRLKWASGDGHIEKPPGDSEEGLSQIISIRKGLMLVLRLLPLLEKVGSYLVA